MRAVTPSAFLALILSLPVAAFCAEPQLASSPASSPASSEVAAVESDAALDRAADDASVSLGTPLATADLEAQRGGDEVVHNVIEISGEVVDNTAHNVATGANSINEGSFANASGITTVVQNTGANVLIQSATIVNVQFTEP